MRWISIATAVRLAAQFLQVVVLARILAPSDFGNMALVAALIGVAQIFADAGISNAVISRNDLSAHKLSTLYWLNMACAAAICVVALALAPVAAAVYAEPVLQPLLWLAGLYVVLNASSQQLRVVAEKELRFGPLAALEITAQLFGLVVSVGLALWGAGVYALMGGLLASASASALLAWPWLAEGWRPAPRCRPGEVKEYLSFGGYIVANNVCSVLSAQVDVALGLKYLGATQLGLYALPKSLCQQLSGVVNPVVNRVTFPVMAKAGGDRALMKLLYLKTTRMTASANGPLFVALALFAPEIVRLVFGEKWAEATPLLQIFAAWALMRSTVNPVGSLAMALGRADVLFKWNAAWVVVSVPAVLAGSAMGVRELALALAAISVATMLANWYYLVRPLCGAGFREYFAEFARPFAISLFCAPAAVVAALPFAGDLARLLAGLAAGGIAYAVLSYFFNRDAFATARELLGLR